MKVSVFALVVFAIIAYVSGACVAPPSDMHICRMNTTTARVPQQYANTAADRNIYAYFNFLDSIKVKPTDSCLLAYSELFCSDNYPRCAGDANSGLGLPVNTCFYICQNFIEHCLGQLVGIERPDCGQYSVEPDCTARLLKF